jgi:hypothetical protein
MQGFFAKASLQDHPLRILEDFLEQEQAYETARQYDKLRFVGYVLDIGYDTVTIITSDPFKINVGGVPRNSLLIMIPSVKVDGAAPHFTLLRVLETAPTPLSRDTQQTYFELQKKSMPELDVFTQSELQWGALQTGVLGMFYPHPDKSNAVEFSGDMNNFVSAHKYKVYAPNDELLDLVVNAMVPQEHRFPLGNLRLTECRLPLPGSALPDVSVLVSTEDFKGTRTAMFGKTRLGKSNVVKLIAQSLIETTTQDKSVGQLIFDINGEYANDNPQDDNASLASAYPKRCTVYALSPKPSTKSKPLKINFYEHPDQSHGILASLLAGSGLDNSIYIKAFLSVTVPSVESIEQLAFGDRSRAKRKVLMYWAVLHRAGFSANEIVLKNVLDLNPGFAEEVLRQVYGSKDNAPDIASLDDLALMLETLIDANRQGPLPSSTKGKNLFDADDVALLDFLRPKSPSSAGPKILQSFRPYHDHQAGDFVREILSLIDDGDTVILDLGNAQPIVMAYFSDYLSRAILQHQVEKFSDNDLGSHYIQLYFEEAHNLFPSRDDESIDIYRRLAKEGAKYHIGMVYSTQSVTTISKDLLGQTENFFIAHLSSQDEVSALAKVNTAYDSLKDDILRAKTPGYMRMLTRSHRFVISTQARKFTPVVPPITMPEAQPTVIPAGGM